jgi:hypothetical protein
VHPIGSCDGCTDFEAIKLDFDELCRRLGTSSAEIDLVANQLCNDLRTRSWMEQAREWPVDETMRGLAPIRLQTIESFQELYGSAFERVAAKFEELESIVLSTSHDEPSCDRNRL